MMSFLAPGYRNETSESWRMALVWNGTSKGVGRVIGAVWKTRFDLDVSAITVVGPLVTLAVFKTLHAHSIESLEGWVRERYVADRLGVPSS